MSIQTRTCVVVLCDGCGEDWWDEGDWPGGIHFTSQAAALEQLAAGMEWQIEDSQQYCPDCAAKHECERNGHQMTSWQTCWCHLNDAGEPTCGHRWRRCGHCGDAYERVSFDTISTV